MIHLCRKLASYFTPKRKSADALTLFLAARNCDSGPLQMGAKAWARFKWSLRGNGK